MAEKSWFLYGPSGTGKSKLAPKLAKKLGLNTIVDPWREGDQTQQSGVLYVCLVPPVSCRRVMHIEFAKRMTRTGVAT